MIRVDQPIYFLSKPMFRSVHSGEEFGIPGGTSMRNNKKSGFKLPEKTYWHLYSLQNLNPEKFIKVVDKVLKQKFVLIK